MQHASARPRPGRGPHRHAVGARVVLHPVRPSASNGPRALPAPGDVALVDDDDPPVRGLGSRTVSLIAPPIRRCRSSPEAARTAAPPHPVAAAAREQQGERERQAATRHITPPRCQLRRSRDSMRLSAQPVALGPQRRLRAVGHVELAEDPRQVRLDGLLADLQAARDQLVRQALDEQRRAPRARARRGRRAGRARSARSRTVRAARGSSGDSPRAAARMPSATSSDVDVLEQVAAGAGLERAEDARAVGERRQHEHRRRRAASATIRRVASIPSTHRHVEVHQHDVGRRARAARSTASAPSAADADELDVVERRRSAGRGRRG